MLENLKIKKNNVIQKIYPTTKIFIMVMYILSTLLISTIGKIPIGLLFWFVLLLIFVYFSGVLKEFLKSMKGIIFVVLFIFILQSLIVKGSDILFEIGFIKIYFEGVRIGTKISLMIVNISGIFLWLFKTTEYKEITRALEEKGMSVKVSFLILSTMQMIDILNRNSKTIMNAQKSRGVETDGNILNRSKAFLPSLIPLVISSIMNTEDRVLTLESKGFEVECTKTHVFNIEKSGYETIAIIFSLLIFILILIGRIILWKI